jgi:hypothetical protein
MPPNSRAVIHRFSAGAVGAVAGPSIPTVTTATVTVPVSDPTRSSSLELPQTRPPSPPTVTSELPRYILPPPRYGQGVAPSVLPSVTSVACVAQQQQQRQQSRCAIRKANVLANWTSSTGPSFTTSGVVTRFESSSPSSSSIPTLDHTISTSSRSESLRRCSFESGSSHEDSDDSRSLAPAAPAATVARLSPISEMPNTYFPLHLSAPDPLQALFRGPNGRALFSSTTDGRTTVIRRLYGRSAQSTRQKQDGLILAEIEWMRRVRGSRIRFKGVDVDVRIDEFLKETRGGRSVPLSSPQFPVLARSHLRFLFLSPSSPSASFASWDGLRHATDG